MIFRILVWIGKISVTDFGIGVSDEDKLHLFERFKRADKHGIREIEPELQSLKGLLICTRAVLAWRIIQKDKGLHSGLHSKKRDMMYFS